MRRPPVACRGAVQSLQSPAAQHIWISDDLLNGALNRFFRSSCPQQKRLGSHVPGPLEARRRAAKRRMTVSAGFYPQESFPQPFSLSALFGLRKDAQPTWRYEAPSLHNKFDPLDQSSEQAPDSSSFRLAERTISTVNAYPFDTPPSFSQNVPHTSSSVFSNSVGGTISGRIDSEAGAVHGSQNIQKDDVATPDAVDIETYFETFKSNVTGAEDLPGSERSKLLADAWRSSRPDHIEAWRYNVMVVSHLTELGWDPTRILSKLKFFAMPPTYSEEGLDFLKCLEKSEARSPHASRVYLRVYMKLAEAAAVAEASKSPSQDLDLASIVRQSLQTGYTQNAKVRPAVADTLSAVASKIHDSHFRKALHSVLTGVNDVEESITYLLTLAAKNYSPCVAVEQVLSCLHPKRVASLIPSITTTVVKAVEWRSRLSDDIHKNRLSTWLAVLQRLDARSESGIGGSSYMSTAIAEVAEHVFTNCNPGKLRPHTLLHALVFRLAQEHPTYASHTEEVLQLIYSSDASMGGKKGLKTLEATLAKILAGIGRSSLPFTRLTNLTVDSYTHHTNLHSLYRLLAALDREGLTLTDPSNVDSLITERMAFLQQQTPPLTEKNRQHYAFTLRTCQDILALLSKHKTPSVTTSVLAAKQKEAHILQARRQFQAILDRAAENHALPHAYRGVTADAPLEQRAILIHQLAHHYSLSTTRSHRETWRAIYYLYSYLSSYSLPVGPLFTKAVVRVSIIRPMIEHRFISARRLIWVCQLVAKVEGEDTARQIESAFHRWRGDLIKYAKGVRDRAGGDRKTKAFVGDMKRLGLI